MEDNIIIGVNKPNNQNSHMDSTHVSQSIKNIAVINENIHGNNLINTQKNKSIDIHIIRSQNTQSNIRTENENTKSQKNQDTNNLEIKTTNVNINENKFEDNEMIDTNILSDQSDNASQKSKTKINIQSMNESSKNQN